MRLHRLRLRHVRGIDAVELAFAQDGVTVVEAPNESGKTTLMDAVDVVLTHKDSTRKHEVRALQPVGHDVGSLIELELTCGGTHMTIRKRFNKDRSTELEVHSPTRRHLTGDEAHDELRRILDGATDLALYQALRFRQGRPLDSLSLADSGSLAARLDEIAGGTGDTGDDVLLTRVRAEFERYFTPSGQDGQLLRAADAAVDAAEARVADLRARERAMDQDVQRLGSLDRDHAELTSTLAELEPALIEHRRRSERVRSLREELRTREARAEVAEAQLERAEREVAQRDELVAKLGTLRAAVEERVPTVELAAAQLTAHEERRAACDDTVERAETREQQARVALDTARAAADLGRRREELAQLTARQQRIDAALASASDAEAQLDAHPLSSSQVQQVRDAAERLRLVEARLNDAAPTVSILAHRETYASIDGESHRLGSEMVERSVADRTIIELPDVARIEVRAGSSLADRQADLDAARGELEAACASAGVDDVIDAEERLRARTDHERALADRDAIVERELAGWTREQLVDRIRTRAAQLRELEARLADATPAGDAHPQLAFVLDADAAVQQLAEVEARDIAARDAAEQARSERAGLAQLVERLRGEVRLAHAELDTRQDHLDEHERRLAEERARVADDDLLTVSREAARRVDHARRSVADTRRELDQLDADRVELLAGNAEERARQARSELARTRDERTELRTTIQVRGGEGVGEALAHASADLERRRDAVSRLRRRAAAAALLRETLERARDAAYASYREPLRDRIVRAGRVVFGDGLDIELDDDLRIAARHLDGVRLPWERLSAGAREQLSILAAIAAADLAGRDGGGVPLVLDDTLGYTDAARLERLAAVLGRVRGPQIVVLTCVGERFRAIGGATVVRLTDLLERIDRDHDDSAVA